MELYKLIMVDCHSLYNDTILCVVVYAFSLPHMSGISIGSAPALRLSVVLGQCQVISTHAVLVRECQVVVFDVEASPS